MSQRDVAVSRLPEARRWVRGALRELQKYAEAGFIDKRPDADQLPAFAGLKTHFHVTRDWPSTVFIRLAYWRILGVLSNPDLFQDGPQEAPGEPAYNDSDAIGGRPRSSSRSPRSTPSAGR
ncbi:MAG: hypothetical protein K2X87_31615 [Gemmataceae bacterium]|nr:hypothetical protein [Gemmataceae bacterium]